jgi:hypothetical protein
MVMLILERLLGNNMEPYEQQKDFPESNHPVEDPWDTGVIAILEREDPAIAALIKKKQLRLSGSY